ncbi:MAG: TRAP transporter substrate-binding protein DctP [Clostridiales Family XIII bacterium]|jgi:TRAP-type C4-dicarboxylate transport system substrate-binding protein|nr:TRAP transporter substrate-binding protein DctP [Clostridiales Family XIII bacterium]
MKKKVISILLVAVLSLTVFSACGSSDTTTSSAGSAPPTTSSDTDATADGEWDFSDATPVNLQVAMYLSDADPQTKDLERWLDLVKEYSEGTIDYTMNAGSTLAAGDEELDAVKNGLADLTFFPVSYGAGTLPLLYMLEYPNALPYTNDEAASYALTDWLAAIQPDELADFHLNFAIGQGNGCFMTTTPLRTFADFSGKQIRCGASQTGIIESYKAKPTVLVFSEVYEAVRTGVVQGFYGMTQAAGNIKLYEVAKYLTYAPYYLGSYISVTNKGVWDSLTPDQQAAFTKATDDAFADFLAKGRYADAATAVEVYKDNGVEIITLSDDDIKLMGDAGASLQTDYAATLDASLDAIAALDLYNELRAKYNDQFK